nr:D-serine ammonia-lyase [Paenisporosarcina indica]
MNHLGFEQPELNNWLKKFPLLTQITNLEPVVWLNPNLKKMNHISILPVNKQDMEEAAELWDRFAPFLAQEFPETNDSKGIIESPLRKIPNMKNALNKKYMDKIKGELLLKCDNELPIAGSIKARGGVYEVLQFAEKLAIEAGLVTKEDDYSIFSSEQFKKLFHQYNVGVGSTGNLGLSIGIIGAKLGFRVSVYMSADAKQWKKDLLIRKGATVHEFIGDFSEAILAGRQQTTKERHGYFVDDENSRHLFLGYSVAAIRLQKQLEHEKIQVDAKHPLFVYLPCGVGGSPGGITFGLKQVFGDHVHCFFVEPTHSPAMLIGLLTGEKEKISVKDFDIDNRTEGDGLAVGRPSSFASSICEKLISGVYTIDDDDFFKMLVKLVDSEEIYLEPSAAAGLIGPVKIIHSDYAKENSLNMKKATHIVWATGGSLVPEKEMKEFYEQGKSLIETE